ncbi:MAG: hypothetical protein V3V24_05785 [Nitrospinaceae bacterium]
METIRCAQCESEFDPQLEQFPHCGTPVPIPNYPRFGGWAFMTMWVFFVILVIVLLVSMFTV